jgi:hypothetical protein
VHHSIIIELNIPSYRLEQAKHKVEALTQNHGAESAARAAASEALPSVSGQSPSTAVRASEA